MIQSFPSFLSQPHRRLRRVAGRAFTLAEVMVAVTVFSLLTLGVYQILIKAYEIAAITRCRDDGRAVLTTFADQFMRLQTTDDETINNPDGSTTSGTYIRELFNYTTSY